MNARAGARARGSTYLCPCFLVPGVPAHVAFGRTVLPTRRAGSLGSAYNGGFPSPPAFTATTFSLLVVCLPPCWDVPALPALPLYTAAFRDLVMPRIRYRLALA